MSWYAYLLQFLSGALLANAVPHFVQGTCGHPFQSPFAKPPGIGESSPVVNVLWGFANFVGGALLLVRFQPASCHDYLGWALVAAGALLISLQLASHFGKVRAKNFSNPTN